MTKIIQILFLRDLHVAVTMLLNYYYLNKIKFIPLQNSRKL